MKAIRKSDGKIIDVEVHGWSGDCTISYHTDFKDFYKPEDLDFNIPKETEQSSFFDWQSFRNQAAKDILSNSLIPYALKEFGETINKDYWTDVAIEWSDKLISKLKEKEVRNE